MNGILLSSVHFITIGKRHGQEIGRKGRETVREKFLLTRYVEQYLDLFGAFDKNFRLRE